MKWESDQENIPESVDYTKRVIFAIPVVIVLMAVFMTVTHEDKSINSRVRVEHILLVTEKGDLEKRKAQHLKILDLKRQIDEGADFNAMAKKYSEDDTSRDNGGTLGWFEREETVKAFDEYIWAGRIGVVSDPIETVFGFHLIKVVRREISTAEQYEFSLHERLNEKNKQSK